MTTTTRVCVNAAHLEAVLHIENMRRVPPELLSHPPKFCRRVGHPLVVENLHVDRNGKRTCLACRRERWKKPYPRPIQPDSTAGGDA